MTARRTARSRNSVSVADTESGSGGNSRRTRNRTVAAETADFGKDLRDSESAREDEDYSGAENARDEDLGDDDEQGSAEVTRCICGHEELQTSHLGKKASQIDPGLFIQCDDCQVWQHGFCVGFYAEDHVPDVYYCERCRPELHVVVVRPSGKTSRYVPSEKKTWAGANGGLTRGNGASGATSNGAGGGDSAGPESRTRAVTKETSPTEGGEPAVGSSARRDTAHRRRTMNSLRDESYEETLKRVLEESVHDVERPLDDDADDAQDRHWRRLPESHGGSSASVKNEVSGYFGDGRSGERHSRQHDGSNARGSEKSEFSKSPSPVPLSEKATTVPAKRKRARAKRNKGSSGATTPGRDSGGGHEGHVSSSGSKSPSKSAGSMPSKKCKPRIPHPRSALPEMRKRVAAILEFIARTQIDLGEEHKERQQLLQERIIRYKEMFPDVSSGSTSGTQFDDLLSLHEANIQFLDTLTHKLLSWEEQFGRYGERPLATNGGAATSSTT